MAPSSPDPLQDLDGPSIYHATPVAPRTIKRTSSVSLSPLKSNKKLSHTTIVNTPTRSPWRIHVYVEAERDDSGSEHAHHSKRSRTTRTKTTKVPLRGLSPSPRGQEVTVARMRRKTTPVRRRGSAAATPGGPGKTPAKSARGRKITAPPLVQEEEEEEEEIDFDEGIGSMIDGMSVLGDDEVALIETRPKGRPTPRKTPAKPRAKTPRKTPHKTPARRVPTVASSSKLPPPPPPPELEDSSDPPSAPSPPRMLSSTPSRSRSRSKSAPRQSLRDFASSAPASNDDDMEGFSMVDTGSLLPDFLNSISQHQDVPADDNDDDDDDDDAPVDGAMLPDSTPPTTRTVPAGTNNTYGAAFRSSPPPQLIQRLRGAKAEPEPKLLLQQSAKKRKRGTPALDSTLVASEGLRSSMGVEDSLALGRRLNMSMTSERFGGGLEEDGGDTDVDTDVDVDVDVEAGDRRQEEEGEEEEEEEEQEEEQEKVEEVQEVQDETFSRALDEGGAYYDDGYDDGVDDTDTDVDEVIAAPPEEVGYHNQEEEEEAEEEEEVEEEEEEEEEEVEEVEEEEVEEVEEERFSPVLDQGRYDQGRYDHGVHDADTESDTDVDEVLPASPPKSVRFLPHDNALEASWAAERAAVRSRAAEVGTLTIADSDLEEDSLEADRIVEDMWLAEAEPRSEDTPVKGKGKGKGRSEMQEKWVQEREAKWKAAEVVVVEEEEEKVEVEEEEYRSSPTREAEVEQYRSSPKHKVEEYHSSPRQEYRSPSRHEEAEEGDTYGAAPGGTTLLGQDTAAFEESLFHREQQQLSTPANGNLFTSSSTPYKRESSASDGRETASSKSSPPSSKSTARISKWRASTKQVQTTPAIASTTMGPPAKPAAAAVIATPVLAKVIATPSAKVTVTPSAKTTATPSAKTIIKTARERREARARRREEVAAAAAAAAAEATTVAVAEVATDAGAEAAVPPAVDESVNMLPDDLLTPPLSFASTTRILSPPPIGPAWEKRHWRLLENLVYAADTLAPAGTRLTYSVSIDDPAALDDDPEALLADPALTVAKMESGERALVLGPKEVEAVRRFRERMKSEGGEREQWGVQEVAAKVGALVLAAVRRKRRAAKAKARRVDRALEKGKGKEKAVVEKGKKERVAENRNEKAPENGKGKEKAVEAKGKGITEKRNEKAVENGKGKVVEKEKSVVLGRAEMAALRAQRRQRAAKPGSRLSDWL